MNTSVLMINSKLESQVAYPFFIFLKFGKDFPYIKPQTLARVQISTKIPRQSLYLDPSELSLKPKEG